MTGPNPYAKKILLLYASAGSGHKKAAEAILKSARAQGLGADILDVVSFMPSWAARLYTSGYTYLISRWPTVWGWLYAIADKPMFAFLNVHFNRFVNARLCIKLIRKLLEEKPDIVISTQFLASEIVSYAKARFSLKTRLVTAITDFGVHNYWLVPETDLYCCASEITKGILLKKEIPEEKIVVTGIPLDEKFLKNPDGDAARDGLGLKKDLLTALIVTGGIGAGPIEAIVGMLKEDIQLLVVCGYNRALQERLRQKKHGNVRVFGFIDNIEELMRASDVVVTKAGGLTVTECLAMKLPMIFFLLIPGQEENNAKLIQEKGAGLIVSSPDELKKRILEFKKNPGLIASFKKRSGELSKPDSSRHIISVSLGVPF